MTKPIEISLAEWAEIIKVREVQEGWGFENDMTAEEFSGRVYGVKFDFLSGGPGYAGDLYILQGDALEQPLLLIRREGVLVIA
jgi:hypothetical protein